MAAQIIEVAPGLDIEALTDVALKSADVHKGLAAIEQILAGIDGRKT